MTEITDIRRMLLEIVAEKDAYIRKDRSNGSLQQGSILQELQKRVGYSQSIEMQQAILTLWYDLFRNGILSWGFNLSNTDPPHCHVTAHGQRILENLSRDPGNPDGYMAFLKKIANPNLITLSYIEEALRTYNSICFKASAVMVGAASESLVLAVQDSIIKKMNGLGVTKPRDLEDWRMKRILSGIETVIKQRKQDISNTLFESFEAYWPAFTHQIRTARNESGHPSSINPVTPDNVHASLLIFPELAKLADNLIDWIDKRMNS
jgi:hypothetical protein